MSLADIEKAVKDGDILTLSLAAILKPPKCSSCAAKPCKGAICQNNKEKVKYGKMIRQALEKKR
ncbi:MAG: hypothetical protein WC565_07870 [Parcubacteria group bacterium]